MSDNKLKEIKDKVVGKDKEETGKLTVMSQFLFGASH